MMKMKRRRIDGKRRKKERHKTQIENTKSQNRQDPSDLNRTRRGWSGKGRNKREREGENEMVSSI